MKGAFALLPLIALGACGHIGVTCEDAWRRLEPEQRRQFESRAAFLEICRGKAFVTVCETGAVVVSDRGVADCPGLQGHDVMFPDG